MSSRRGFLKLGLVAGGVTLVGGGLVYTKVMVPRALAEQLVYFLDYPDMARDIGEAFLESDQALHKISLEQMIDRILVSLGVSKPQLSETTRGQLLEQLHQRVRLDFSNEQIVLVNGWVLSQTEARICSLLALLG